MNETTFSYLDAYCERAGEAGLWAEPLNAVSNLLFILAAILAARVLLRSSQPLRVTWSNWLLVLVLASIGVGSGLWHLYATSDTMLMDVIPIVAFINIYLLVALRRVVGLGWWKVILFWLGYQVLNVASESFLPRDTLNGSIMYIPTLITLGLLSWAVWVRDRAAGKAFFTVLAVFALSLTFRTIDLEICTALPIGTHFLWHALNAWVLWRLLMVLIRR